MLGTVYYLLEIMKLPKEGSTSFLHGAYSLMDKTDIQMISSMNAQTVKSAMKGKTTVPREQYVDLALSLGSGRLQK